jgi:iron complex outermembrane receptor protein
MKAKHSRLTAALAAVHAAAALAAQPALGQQAQRVEKIEVTGSNIKRVEGEGPSAVLVLTRDEIDRTGASNAYELLNIVAANQSAGGVSIANTVGALTFSASTASLRGLGGGRTLVLINGKRLNSFAGEIQGVQGVNLSTIPFSAIERVEILLDGASAIYGSDAIAGVINFIMRRDYRGAEATVNLATPTRGGPGGDQQRYQAALGFGDPARDRYNVFIAAQHERQDALEQRHRSFSNTAVRSDIGLVGFSGTPFPGFVTTGNIGSVGFPDCGLSDYFPLFGERCFYDPARQVGVVSIPESESSNLFASGTFHFSDALQAYATGNYSRQRVNLVIQPVPIADIFGVPITLPPDSPFYPTAAAIAAGVNGQPLNVRWRAVENGNRDSTDTNEQWQVVAGLKGTAGRWDWDASATLNEGRTKQKLDGGFPLNSLIQPLLNSGRVNLFGPNTPEVSDEVRATSYVGPTFDATGKSNVVDARFSGELLQLPAGPLGVAFGAQRGAEELSQNPAPVLATGDLSGFGGNVLPLDRDRDTWAAYAEASVPLTRALELNAAVRHDDYSDFGGTTNPKVWLRWQPRRDVLVRASHGTGFLAPSLYQLYNGNTTGVTQAGLSDPLRSP